MLAAQARKAVVWLPIAKATTPPPALLLGRPSGLCKRRAPRREAQQEPPLHTPQSASPVRDKTPKASDGCLWQPISNGASKDDKG